MRELTKNTLAILIVAGATAAAIAWFDPFPNTTIWSIRIGGLLMLFGAATIYLLLRSRKDRVPDFLFDKFKAYYDRRGLCFVCDAVLEDGICFFRVHFQNRYSNPCKAKIALRARRRSALYRSGFHPVIFQIDCPAAGYGIASAPVPFDARFQGFQHTFEIGASVWYPARRGKMLRYRDGGLIRPNYKCHDPVGKFFAFGRIFVRRFVSYEPPSATLSLPHGVAETIPTNVVPKTEIIWQLDDDPEYRLATKSTSELFSNRIGNSN
jgi:hypothetical protein